MSNSTMEHQVSCSRVDRYRDRVSEAFIELFTPAIDVPPISSRSMRDATLPKIVERILFTMPKGTVFSLGEMIRIVESCAPGLAASYPNRKSLQASVQHAMRATPGLGRTESGRMYVRIGFRALTGRRVDGVLVLRNEYIGQLMTDPT